MNVKPTKKGSVRRIPNGSEKMLFTQFRERERESSVAEHFQISRCANNLESMWRLVAFYRQLPGGGWGGGLSVRCQC